MEPHAATPQRGAGASWAFRLTKTGNRHPGGRGISLLPPGRRTRDTVALYLLERMRFKVVPQTGHLPCSAGRPFFIVTCFASAIARLVLHFTQYASGFSSAIPASPQIASQRPILHDGRMPPVVRRDVRVPAWRRAGRTTARSAGPHPAHSEYSEEVHVAHSTTPGSSRRRRDMNEATCRGRAMLASGKMAGL